VVEQFELPEPRVRTVVLRAANGLRIELIEREGSTAQRFNDPLEAALTRGYGRWALEVEDLDQTFAALSGVGAEPVSPPAPEDRQGGGPPMRWSLSGGGCAVAMVLEGLEEHG
jgi:hypothetical protein